MNDPLVFGYLVPLLVAALSIFSLFYSVILLTAGYGAYAEESSQALERWLELQGLTVLSTRLRGGGPYHKIRVSDNLGHVYSGWVYVRAIQDRLKWRAEWKRDETGDLLNLLGPLASGYKFAIEWDGHAPFGVPLSGEIPREKIEGPNSLADEIDKESPRWKPRAPSRTHK